MQTRLIKFIDAKETRTRNVHMFLASNFDASLSQFSYSLNIGAFKKNIHESGFACFGPLVWNSLQITVWDLSSTFSFFCSSLKTELFCRAYDNNSSFCLCDSLSVCKSRCVQINRHSCGYFSRGTDTILGESSDRRELFLVDDCQDIYVDFIVNKVQVVALFSI